MKIESQDRVRFPRDLVFITVRDRVPEIVDFLPNVKRIDDLSREELDGNRVKIIRRWFGKGEVPAAAQKVVKPEMLSWVDTAIWDLSKFSCSWELTHETFTSQFRCSGMTLYQEEGNACTRIEFTGDLSLDLNNIAGVPRLIARSFGPIVEKVLVSLITPNLSHLPKALGTFLAQTKK